MTTQATTLSFTQRSVAAIGSALQRAFNLLERSSRGARAAAEAERLFAMTDAELARMGLRRSDILHHAFGPRLYL
jgi:hypothetical protein